MIYYTQITEMSSSELTNSRWLDIEAESPEIAVEESLKIAALHGWSGPGYRVIVYEEGGGPLLSEPLLERETYAPTYPRIHVQMNEEYRKAIDSISRLIEHHKSTAARESCTPSHTADAMDHYITTHTQAATKLQQIRESIEHVQSMKDYLDP